MVEWEAHDEVLYIMWRGDHNVNALFDCAEIWHHYFSPSIFPPCRVENPYVYNCYLSGFEYKIEKSTKVADLSILLTVQFFFSQILKL